MKKILIIFTLVILTLSLGCNSPKGNNLSNKILASLLVQNPSLDAKYNYSFADFDFSEKYTSKSYSSVVVSIKNTDITDLIIVDNRELKIILINENEPLILFEGQKSPAPFDKSIHSETWLNEVMLKSDFKMIK